MTPSFFKRGLLPALLCVLLLTACDASGVKEARSGTRENAFVEEPLAEPVIQYKDQLAKSNAYVEMLVTQNYAGLHAGLEEKLKAGTTPNTFKDLNQQILTAYGVPVDYKPQQWWFIRETKDGTDMLVSRKLIKHEKALVEYDFTFSPNDKEMKLIGFFMRESKKTL